MRLRTKTILTVFLFSLLMFGTLQIITVFVLQPSFASLERQENTQKVNQAMKVLNYRIEELAVKVEDYAFWDDSYNYAQNLNSDYIQSNFADSTFENLNLNLIAIADTNHKIVYCQSYDLNSSSKTQTKPETQETLASDDYLWTFNSSDNAMAGIIILENKPMLVATAPLLTSEMQGPARGGMLFGRYLDDEAISELSGLVGFDLSVSVISDFRLKGNQQIVDSLLSTQESIALKENGAATVSGYTLIKDIHSNPAFVLTITYDRTVYQQSLLVGNFFLVAAIFISIFFGLFLQVLLEREIVRPMKRLAAYVEEVSLNPNLESPAVASHTAEEVGVVTDAVRDTLRRKLEGMYEVSRMVAHDLRNPLTGMKNAAYILRKRYGKIMDKDGLAMLQTIDNCVDYSDKIVQNLLEYSSEIRLDKLKVGIKRLVDSALSKSVIPQNIKVVNETNDDFIVDVDPTKIERAFTNLIVNALDAMQTGGTLSISSKKNKDLIQIDFCDTGVGMSKEVQEKLWMPFFTTKAKGMGIGLSISKRMVDAHGGKIEAHSIEGNGACFSVFLPEAE